MPLLYLKFDPRWHALDPNHAPIALNYKEVAVDGECIDVPAIHFAGRVGEATRRSGDPLDMFNVGKDKARMRIAVLLTRARGMVGGVLWRQTASVSKISRSRLSMISST